VSQTNVDHFSTNDAQKFILEDREVSKQTVLEERQILYPKAHTFGTFDG
jgi:hypothetical protein